MSSCAKRRHPTASSSNAAEENGQQYDFVFVDQIGFNKHAPKTFAALAASYLDYRTESPDGMSNDLSSMNGHAQSNEAKARVDEACRLYAAGEISRGPAARLAGLSRSEFDHELFVRKIPSYTTEMLEQDLATLSRIR